VDQALESLAAGNVESSMVLILTTEGDRMYMHPFVDDLSALEFLELMVATFRTDMMEKIIKRSMN
jgi:hypothetical protein